uniref:C-type lectin domain-containing protein n=1 Tax=Sinocyclocheilus anshuiensis TaxID=1608454 RepID=A0A671L496_9TELE
EHRTKTHQYENSAETFNKTRIKLLSEIENLLKMNDELVNAHNEMTKQNHQLATNMVVLPDGWTCYQSSLYYISSEEKNWNDSYQDCLKRGANLTIINSNKDKDFLKTYGEVWIGLTNMEGTWKWVDGSTLTSSFWASGEPNGHTKKDCAVTSKHLDKPEVCIFTLERMD